MKICLFGGTFDPPHIGHLLIAQTICEAEDFDKIVFIPAYNPPHKNDHPITPIDLRLQMLASAVAENPRFEISEIEIKRGGISYSLDTIRQYKKKKGLQSEEVFFLIGSDTLLEFHNWNHPKEILEECRVIVALRPGFTPSDIPNWILKKVRFANIPRFEISSSIIRYRWQNDMTIRYMVTQPVWEFINSHNLYSK